MQGTPILDVGDAFDGHPAMPVHGQTGWAQDPLSIPAEAGFVLGVARVVRNEGLGFEVMENVTKNGFDIVLSVTGNGFGLQAQGGHRRGEQRDGDRHLADRIGFGDFPQRQFGFQISQSMIAVAPEVFDLTFVRAGIMDAHAQPGVRVTPGGRSFIEPIGAQRGFEVVFPDPTGNGTGVQAEVAALHYAQGQQGLGQLGPDGLEGSMGSISQKATEPFHARRRLIGIKAQSGQNGGTFQQVSAQVLQESAPSQPLVDGGFKQGAPIIGFSSLLSRRLRPWRQELEEFFPA